jgi:hypothetical protein
MPQTSLSPEQIAAKWKKNTNAAVNDYKVGIKNMKDNPLEKAIAKQEKMKTNWLASIDSGKWAARLGAYSFTAWQNACIEKGAVRITSGVNAAEGKMVAFMKVLMPHINEGRALLSNMSTDSFEDNLARMEAMARHMHALSYK